MVTLYLEKARKSPCRTCSYTDCKKLRRVKAFCSIHAMEVLGKDAVPDERNMPRNYCKYPGCAKWRHLKGFCMQHAHEKLDEEVVEEFQNHQKKKAQKTDLNVKLMLTHTENPVIMEAQNDERGSEKGRR